jgi:putative membrane protein
MGSVATFALAIVGVLFAQEEVPAATRWRPDSLAMAVLSVVIFTVIGILASLAGFKLWDRFTPGNLEEEICKKQNIAAAILGAAIILGICIIIAAAMIG